MKFDKSLIISFMAPLMILISTFGLIFKDNNKKIFYLPVGLMGIAIILEKSINRKLKRNQILKKIRSYQKVK